MIKQLNKQSNYKKILSLCFRLPDFFSFKYLNVKQRLIKQSLVNSRMSKQAIATQSKIPVSPKLMTAKDIFKQLIRRQNNGETNAIASPANTVHAVHKISDNLDDTRGRSSTQIKKHMFGTKDLANSSSQLLKNKSKAQSKALQYSIISFAMKMANPQVSNSKKFQYKVYKPKPRTKERDQQLLKRLYNQIKQQKQLQAFQKQQRKQELKRKIQRPATYKPLFSYAPESMKFLQNQKYWANFKAQMDKTVEFENSSQCPVTPVSSQRLKKGQSYCIQKTNFNDQNVNRMNNSALSNRQSWQEKDQKDNQMFKTFKNFEKTPQPKGFFKSRKSRYQKAKSTNLTNRSYGSKKNNLSETKFKHPVSQIYDEAADSIFSQRKNNKKGQLSLYISKLSPFGNLQNIDM